MTFLLRVHYQRRHLSQFTSWWSDESPQKVSISYFMLRLCSPAWSVSACLLPSLTGTQSPSRPSTGSTATPSTGRLLVGRCILVSWNLFLPSFSDLMGLEHGVWAQAGLGTTPWSPAPTPSTGATITQAEPSHSEFCFIVNSKLIFKRKIKDWQKLNLVHISPTDFHFSTRKEKKASLRAMQEMVIVLLSPTSLSLTLLCVIPKIYIAPIPRKEMERGGLVSESRCLKKDRVPFGGLKGDFVQRNSWSGLRVGVNCGIWHQAIASTGVQSPDPR